MSHKGNKPGTERHRDEQREDRGPVYHGVRDWTLAEDEADREALNIPAEEEATPDIETADEQISDPGTRGANFGRGGVGIVERDVEPQREEEVEPNRKLRR
jgi:hypothetical protein